MRKFHFNKTYALFLFILTALFLSACSNSSEKAAQDFKETVDDRDPEGLLELVTVDEGTYWTEQQAQQVIETFHDDSGKYQEQLRLLEQQVNALDEDTMLSNEEGLFYFDDEGELRVRNYEVTVTNETSDLEPDQITITVDEGDALEVENLDDTLGLFGPGEYTFAAEGEFPYATVNSEGSFSLLSSDSFNQSINLDLQGSFVYITSSVDNTKLLVNGEEADTEITADEYGYMDGVEFGPVSDGNTLQGVVEFPWEEAQSEELTVGSEEEYDITPGILTSEEDREEMTELLNNYFESRMAALVELEIDELTEDVSEELRESLNDDIKSDINSESSHDGEVFGTRIDFGSPSYELGSGGRHYVTLPVEVHREYGKNYKYGGDDDPKEEYVDRSMTLEYLEDEDKWIISEENSSGFGSNEPMTGDDIVETEL
ncbi:TcaA 3rd/4th domain-containing protein [Oceanobacillus jeddahense]|uniref:Uncharacterized protein n=1 Tax=Oceanobacillus jeddahense TaxID=1462527 RepID=A0ABY5JX22_9BACI|nr:hypothetical protein [Oceanobacillus jeddahense]UUI03114.1 hypothetical protein NP439_24310 [Oceanobacillus jeddahense]